MIKPKTYEPSPARYLLSSRYRFARHFLLLLAIVVMACQNIGQRGDTQKEILNTILSVITFSGISYFNIYFLTPVYLLKNKLGAYLLSSIGSILCAILFIVAIQLTMFPPSQETTISSTWFIALNIFAVSIQFGLLIAGISTLLLFRQWLSHEQRIDELEGANMRSELEQLKKQINPHFLFNMLNNAHVLTKKNPTAAVEVLSKLKALLRYQINDSSREGVGLQADIRFLTDFLNLEKIRRDQFEYGISIEGDMEGVLIPPLLFIPFVENAVKHSLDSTNSSSVYLSFERDGQQLKFMCINSKPAEIPRKQESGGLGLVNIKRRLELLYGEDYFLESKENATSYTVILQIRL